MFFGKMLTLNKIVLPVRMPFWAAVRLPLKTVFSTYRVFEDSEYSGFTLLLKAAIGGILLWFKNGPKSTLNLFIFKRET